MSAQDALALSIVVLYLAVLYAWRERNRIEDERRKDGVRLSVLEKRTDLLTSATRELRPRDPEQTVKMTPGELARAKRGQGPPRGH